MSIIRLNEAIILLLSSVQNYRSLKSSFVK